MPGWLFASEKDTQEGKRKEHLVNSPTRPPSPISQSIPTLCWGDPKAPSEGECSGNGSLS